jgi:hypothetical protein
MPRSSRRPPVIHKCPKTVCSANWPVSLQAPPHTSYHRANTTIGRCGHHRPRGYPALPGPPTHLYAVFGVICIPMDCVGPPRRRSTSPTCSGSSSRPPSSMLGPLELATEPPLLHNTGILGLWPPRVLCGRESGHDGAHPAPASFEGAMPNAP